MRSSRGKQARRHAEEGHWYKYEGKTADCGEQRRATGGAGRPADKGGGVGVRGDGPTEITPASGIQYQVKTKRIIFVRSNVVPK